MDVMVKDYCFTSNGEPIRGVIRFDFSSGREVWAWSVASPAARRIKNLFLAHVIVMTGGNSLRLLDDKLGIDIVTDATCRRRLDKLAKEYKAEVVGKAGIDVFQVACEHIVRHPEMLSMIVIAAKSDGFADGKESSRKEIREALGL